MQAVCPSPSRSSLPGALLFGAPVILSSPKMAEAEPPFSEPPLWQLIAELLPSKDPETEWFSVREIAPLLGLKPRSVMKHCRDLWPNWQGQYRLNQDQAVSVIRRVVFAGRKLPSRATIERKLRAKAARK